MHISRSPDQAEMSARKSRRTNETTCLSAYKFYIKRKKKEKDLYHRIRNRSYIHIHGKFDRKIDIILLINITLFL